MNQTWQISSPWKAFRKLSYIGLIWMCVCYIAFRFSTSDVSQTTFLGLPAHRALLQKIQQDAPGSGSASSEVSRSSAPFRAGSDGKAHSVGPSGRGVALSSSAAGGVGDNGASVVEVPLSDAIVNSSLAPPIAMIDREVKIDRDAKNIDNVLSQLREVSNIPYAYWDPKIVKPPISSKSCVKYPPLYDLQFNNLYWQKLNTNNGSFFIYGAYLDVRARVGRVPLVRVLAMIDRIKPPPVYCLLWYDDATLPVVSLASFTYAWYSKWGNYKDGFLQPYAVSCPAPFQKGRRSLYPSSVSLVERQCTPPTNNVRVIYNTAVQKQDFAVCVKGLDFLRDDLSVRLIEWIELINLLGAKKIFFYELEVHPNISKVLRHYVDLGVVDNTPLTLPGDMPNLPALRHEFLNQRRNHKRQNELIPYNDCLYRNLYLYNYIVLLDVDEVIMPIKHASWSDLMRDVLPIALRERNYTRASYNFRNVYFMDDMLTGAEMQHEVHEVGIPPYMHMLQHVYRAQNFTKPGAYVKCFHDTQRVVTLHNHFPLNCFGSCTTFSVPVDMAQLQHYRKDCVGPLKKSCETEFKSHTVRDTTIWRHKDELIARVTKTLQLLGFFN